MSNYLFTLQPTFTQGFVLGQLSVFFLLALILKYLFWNSGPEPQFVSLPPNSHRRDPHLRKGKDADGEILQPNSDIEGESDESLEWLNRLLLQAVQSYRARLREYLDGPEAEHAIRDKVEAKINELRPSYFIDHVKVHSVDIGNCAPRLSRARVDPEDDPEGRGKPGRPINFWVSYTDSITISLSTSIVLHYPRPFFARLPIALTLSLVMFSSKLELIPPTPESETPCLTFRVAPDFELEIETNSLLGSRAKLADVPKVHEMIVNQIRRIVERRGTWRIMLPGTGGRERDGTREEGSLGSSPPGSI